MKIKYLSIFALLLVLFSSCENFLDVKSEGDPTSNTYFTNDGQAIDAIDGLYAPIPQEDVYGRELFWEQAAANDIVWARTRSYNTLATFNYTGNESPLRTVFETLYQNMSRSNWENTDLSDGQIKYASEDATVVYDVMNRILEEYPFAMNIMPSFFQAQYTGE